MYRISKLLLLSLCVAFAGTTTAQPTSASRISPIQMKHQGAAINPAAITRMAPLNVTIPQDAESQVQAEIKRLQRTRDNLNSTLAKVSANFSRVTNTPVTGNSCIDPDTTWNARSGESFTCAGQTTCTGRMSRWSKNRSIPCEPGVVIDSCVTSDECKGGSVCDTGAQVCVRR